MDTTYDGSDLAAVVTYDHLLVERGNNLVYPTLIPDPSNNITMTTNDTLSDADRYYEMALHREAVPDASYLPPPNMVDIMKLLSG